MITPTEQILAMHHRSLPVGTTEVLQERRTLVVSWLEASDTLIWDMEHRLSEAQISTSADLLSRYHEAKLRHRQGERAYRILDRELAKRRSHQ
jgi:hypothetical protein